MQHKTNVHISIFALGTVTSNAYFSVNKSLHHYKSNNKMCLLLFILAHSLSSKPIDSKCNSFLGRRAIVHRFAGSRVRSALEQFCFEKFFECKIDRDAWKHIAVVGTHAIGHGQRRNAWVHFHLQFVNVVWLMWCVRKRMTSEYAHRYRLRLRQWHSHRQINVDAFILPLSLYVYLSDSISWFCDYYARRYLHFVAQNRYKDRWFNDGEFQWHKSPLSLGVRP